MIRNNTFMYLDAEHLSIEVAKYSGWTETIESIGLDHAFTTH